MADELREPASKQEAYLSAIRQELDTFERRERDFRAQGRREQAQHLTERFRLRGSDFASID
ncbi:hypothetical protein IP86_23885 [Rhodopseudomonas sp. AAP120]|uniref:hypothetical protein n=1 Tax=Rhodopseudomonas sp. AAP120 TaxID=1523430 RepID=UPI0006B9A89F|nr:hypothetical protein [Rhodopseudomonas sp. AAP120]KPF93001.1 hypothetical protein IP86_23885 [Rhodopseudomonas sp. AAP120]